MNRRSVSEEKKSSDSIELVHRGCTEEDIDKMKITARKTKLKALEIKRVADNGADATEKEAAHKAFKPLSGALFPVK
jgi:hypothetical protein